MVHLRQRLCLVPFTELTDCPEGKHHAIGSPYFDAVGKPLFPDPVVIVVKADIIDEALPRCTWIAASCNTRPYHSYGPVMRRIIEKSQPHNYPEVRRSMEGVMELGDVKEVPPGGLIQQADMIMLGCVASMTSGSNVASVQTVLKNFCRKFSQTQHGSTVRMPLMGTGTARTDEAIEKLIREVTHVTITELLTALLPQDKQSIPRRLLIINPIDYESSLIVKVVEEKAIFLTLLDKMGIHITDPRLVYGLAHGPLPQHQFLDQNKFDEALEYFDQALTHLLNNQHKQALQVAAQGAQVEPFLAGMYLYMNGLMTQKTGLFDAVVKEAVSLAIQGRIYEAYWVGQALPILGATAKNMTAFVQSLKSCYLDTCASAIESRILYENYMQAKELLDTIFPIQKVVFPVASVADASSAPATSAPATISAPSAISASATSAPATSASAISAPSATSAPSASSDALVFSNTTTPEISIQTTEKQIASDESTQQNQQKVPMSPEEKRQFEMLADKIPQRIVENTLHISLRKLFSEEVEPSGAKRAAQNLIELHKLGKIQLTEEQFRSTETIIQLSEEINQIKENHSNIALHKIILERLLPILSKHGTLRLEAARFFLKGEDIAASSAENRTLSVTKTDVTKAWDQLYQGYQQNPRDYGILAYLGLIILMQGQKYLGIAEEFYTLLAKLIEYELSHGKYGIRTLRTPQKENIHVTITDTYTQQAYQYYENYRENAQNFANFARVLARAELSGSLDFYRRSLDGLTKIGRYDLRILYDKLLGETWVALLCRSPQSLGSIPLPFGEISLDMLVNVYKKIRRWWKYSSLQPKKIRPAIQALLQQMGKVQH